MTVVQSRRLILTSFVDPTRAVALPMAWGSSQGWPREGERRQYATADGKGRFAGVLSAAYTQDWSPVISAYLPLAVTTYLLTYAGEPHVARDPLGGRIVCWWLDAPRALQGNRGGGELATIGGLRLEQLTQSLSV